MSTNLDIDSQNIQFEKTHRIPARTGKRSIIVQFTHLYQRDAVIRKFRQKRKQGTLAVRVNEDFPERISKAHTGPYPLMKESIDQGKTAFFKYDQLVVDRQHFAYDTAQKKNLFLLIDRIIGGQSHTIKLFLIFVH